nr:DUF3052 domain-containing protein [Streptoalloteichus hindustanus]
MGFEPGQTVQEIGFDEDTDGALREAIENRIGQSLADQDFDDEVDAVVLWFREEDGDLVDALVDARTLLVDTGVVWLLTPASGRAGYVEASDISDSAVTAGLQIAGSAKAAPDWSGTRLVAPKTSRARR